MAGRQLRTSNKMFPLIEQYMSSGLAQKTFCTQHGLSIGVFYDWYKKYLREQQTTGRRKFAEVQVGAEQARCIVIRYTSGTEVHIPW